ncbi:MAG: site-specific integrase [Candidatus Dormibacteraceae bacterium]
MFDPIEAAALRRAVTGDRLEALWILALALGLRQGELLGLRWDDVDLVGRVLDVRKQLQRVDGKLGLVSLKTRKSRRRLPMPVFVVNALEAHQERQRSEGVANLLRLVFTNEVGQPIDARRLQTRFKRLLKRAGLADRPFHALRHSAATFLLLQHVDMKVVSEILGHSNLATTSGRYSHVLDQMKRDAAARLDVLWDEA